MPFKNQQIHVTQRWPIKTGDQRQLKGEGSLWSGMCTARRKFGHSRIPPTSPASEFSPRRGLHSVLCRFHTYLCTQAFICAFLKRLFFATGSWVTNAYPSFWFARTRGECFTKNFSEVICTSLGIFCARVECSCFLAIWIKRSIQWFQGQCPKNK